MLGCPTGANKTSYTDNNNNISSITATLLPDQLSCCFDTYQHALHRYGDTKLGDIQTDINTCTYVLKCETKFLQGMGETLNTSKQPTAPESENYPNTVAIPVPHTNIEFEYAMVTPRLKSYPKQKMSLECTCMLTSQVKKSWCTDQGNTYMYE